MYAIDADWLNLDITTSWIAGDRKGKAKEGQQGAVLAFFHVTAGALFGFSLRATWSQAGTHVSPHISQTRILSRTMTPIMSPRGATGAARRPSFPAT